MYCTPKAVNVLGLCCGTAYLTAGILDKYKVIFTPGMKTSFFFIFISTAGALVVITV